MPSMRRPALLAAMLMLLLTPAGAFDYRALHLLEDRHTHLILRLSEAPPEGDGPARGRAECNDVEAIDRKTRNLAQRFGRALQRSSIQIDAILTSRICRNIEAAKLLAIGPVTIVEALDPPPEGEVAEAQRDAILALIEDRRAYETVLLITHEPVIRALTGETLEVGKAMVFRLPPFDDIEVRATFGVPPI